MNRRLFMATAAMLFGTSTLLSAGEGTVNYEPGLIEKKLAAGETVFVDYAASWCSTCKRQERIINDIRASNPEFDKNISFVRVDWDTYSSHDVTKLRNVPRRSTLLILKGDEELGRIVAGTSKEKIKELLELGLSKV